MKTKKRIRVHLSLDAETLAHLDALCDWESRLQGPLDTRSRMVESLVHAKWAASPSRRRKASRRPDLVRAAARRFQQLELVR